MTNFIVKKLSYAERLGWAVSIICSSRRYDRFPIASLCSWLIPNIRLKQVEIIFDANELPAGYVSWAYLTDELERRWLSDEPGVWHLSEFKEGDSLWIIDFVALPGQIMVCIEATKSILGSHESVKFSRSRRDGQLVSVTTWSQSAQGRFKREDRKSVV